MSGFIFVDQEAPDYLKEAAAGSRVTLPSFEPPWLVVDHSLDRVVVARWPGRLFRAEIVPPATDAERAAMARAAERLSSDAGYTRAVSIDLVEEISPTVLFGPHGDAVRAVLEAGCALDEESARRLASARQPAADHAYSAAWERWLGEQPNGAVYQGQSHASIVAISGAGPSESPIGHGFSVLSRAVYESARLRGGESAHARDEDGDWVLLDPWRTASAALLDAAMALGAPHLVGERTGTLLTKAWNAVHGR
ncbi:hypothetical protein LZ318_40020 [Saccharopolyspora indica]|uniref:hypothetical protein n=1 Tax=Saccharopolyspora indica TaxID=1229659 RepID=UPI0022EB0DCD|nr:hypothetical protein [Saccharopolyspora indica]MDA3650203.1 hypothetical protein [Saccharopolyspora indica]